MDTPFSKGFPRLMKRTGSRKGGSLDKTPFSEGPTIKRANSFRTIQKGRITEKGKAVSLESVSNHR